MPMPSHDGRKFALSPPRRKTASPPFASAQAEQADDGEIAAGSPVSTNNTQPPRKRRRQTGNRFIFYEGVDIIPFESTSLAEAQRDTSLIQDSVAALPQNAQIHQLYDKVLVDAECTHDGSIKHLAKFAQWGWDTFERRFLDPARVTELATLQYGLLRAGFQLLRPGGTLVYSTCSFARAQNEDVVSKLLEMEPCAQLVRVNALAGAPSRPGTLPHTLRFDPQTSQTSGLFIASITKDYLCK
jgi:hypothetical protein